MSVSGTNKGGGMSNILKSISLFTRLLYFIGIKKKVRCLSSNCLFKGRRDSDWGGDIYICTIIQRPLRVDWYTYDCSSYEGEEEIDVSKAI